MCVCIIRLRLPLSALVQFQRVSDTHESARFSSTRETFFLPLPLASRVSITLALVILYHAFHVCPTLKCLGVRMYVCTWPSVRLWGGRPFIGLRAVLFISGRRARGGISRERVPMEFDEFSAFVEFTDIGTCIIYWVPRRRVECEWVVMMLMGRV